jgi:general secretion pathway protein E
MIKKDIISIIRDEQLVSPEQLVTWQQEYEQEKAQAALSTPAKPLSNFDEYVQQRPDLSDIVLARAYAIKSGLPFLETIAEKQVNSEVLLKVPLKFLREYSVIPIKIGADNRIVLVTAQPFNFQPLDELTLIYGNQTERAVAPRSLIIDAINRYYPLEGTKEVIAELEEEQDIAAGSVDFGAIDEEDILGMASEAPIIKLVNHVLYQAVKRGASDIHIEPFEKELHIRYRIDGVLYPALMPPKRVQSALVSRIKIMSGLNIAEKRQPQDGRIQIKIADKAIDIRLSVLPVSFGERVVMRLLDKTKTFGALTTLGLSKRDYNVMLRTIEQPNGIMFITGPTGSGKTSTLYSILHELNKPDVNIITVEDPVEYQLVGLGQVQVREKIGLTFAVALRSVLRQDPDIVMIGETRDHETAQIAIQAALTGHLVLSTLHTNSAAAAITRLIDMGIEPFLIASTVTTVMAQRLVRRVCKLCATTYKPSVETLRRLGLTESTAAAIIFYQAHGCDECLGTGYKGRLAIFEIMVMTPAISRLTIERADTLIIQNQAIKDGMTLLVDDGIEKIKEGLTTVDEVLSVAVAQEVV